MNTDTEARAAITGMNGKDLKGRPIRVDEARPPRPR
jgi:RNA recognition motif-containing protein